MKVHHFSMPKDGMCFHMCTECLLKVYKDEDQRAAVEFAVESGIMNYDGVVEAADECDACNGVKLVPQSLVDAVIKAKALVASLGLDTPEPTNKTLN